MDEANPLDRADCPVTPLGIDAEGRYVFLNDKKELVVLTAAELAPGSNDDGLNVLFTTEAGLNWARANFPER